MKVFLENQTKGLVNLAEIYRSSPTLYKQLHALWRPDAEWSTVDISSMAVAGGETAASRQAYEAMLLVLQAVFSDPWSPDRATEQTRWRDRFKKQDAVYSMGRTVTTLRANNCGLEQAKPRFDGAPPQMRFGAFIDTAMTGYDRNLVRVAPCKLLRPELLELELRGNELRGADMKLL